MSVAMMATSGSVSPLAATGPANPPLQVRSFLNVDETVGWLAETTSPLSSAGSISPPEQSGLMPLSVATAGAGIIKRKAPGGGVDEEANDGPEPKSPAGPLDETHRMPLSLDGDDGVNEVHLPTYSAAVPKVNLNAEDIAASPPGEESSSPQPRPAAVRSPAAAAARPSRRDAPVILFEPAEASDEPTPNSTSAALAAAMATALKGHAVNAATSAASPLSKSGTMGRLPSPTKMMLRVTKSKFSCIRHCCPVDNTFFSSKKEFHLWDDVLQNATKELWDGENVSLLLHGAAQNMSLFGDANAVAVPVTVSPQQGAGGIVDASVSPATDVGLSGPTGDGTKKPVAGAGKPNPTSAPGTSKRVSSATNSAKHKAKKSTHNHNNHAQQGGEHARGPSALENILQALLVEVKHREVPLHYSAQVAVGACILLGNGEISDIAPQVEVVDEPFAQIVEPVEDARGGKLGGKRTTGNSGGPSPAGSTTGYGGRKAFPGLPPASPTASAGSARTFPRTAGGALQDPKDTSPAASITAVDEKDTDTLVDHTGATVRMRMFPVACAEDVEEFAAHIGPICALHMRKEQQEAAAAAAAAVLGLSTHNSVSGGGDTRGVQVTDPNDGPKGGAGTNTSDSESVTPATGRSPRDSSAFAVDAFDPTHNQRSKQQQPHHHHHAGSGTSQQQQTVLLISVQLRQICSLVSKPRTSYIRVAQLIRAPSIVEDVLMSISTGKPLPVFASHIAKVIHQRIQEATQIVFVQSCVPATALEVIPALASAKGVVVKTELAAVAEDIVQASQAFLDTRQTLREQLKHLREEFKTLRQTCHGKERELRRASMVGLDFGGSSGGGVDAAAAAAAAVAAQQRLEKQQAAAALLLPKAAADHLTRHNRPATMDILSGMSFKCEEDVVAAEEAVLTFKEHANIEKQDAERDIEGQQKELGTHGDKVLQLRRQMDDLKKKLQTSTYEHGMSMQDLRQVLQHDYDALLRATGALPSSSAAAGDLLSRSGTMSTSAVSVVRQLRSAASGGGSAARKKTATTNVSTAVKSNLPSRIIMSTSMLSSSAGDGTMTHSVPPVLTATTSPQRGQSNMRSDTCSMERFLAELIRQRNDKQATLDKAVVSLDKKRRAQEHTTELCERHVAALRDYSFEMYSVFKHVEAQARLTHSIDDALAASQLEAFEGVQHVDNRLIRMPRAP